MSVNSIDRSTKVFLVRAYPSRSKKYCALSNDWAAVTILEESEQSETFLSLAQENFVDFTLI